MNGNLVRDLTVDQLVGRFVRLCLEQDEAMWRDEHSRFNVYFDQMIAVESELKARAGDQRSALFGLLRHENPQVRLRAAQAVISFAPDAARGCLQDIIDTDENPQAVDARSFLRAIDEGHFSPT